MWTTIQTFFHATFLNIPWADCFLLSFAHTDNNVIFLKRPCVSSTPRLVDEECSDKLSSSLTSVYYPSLSTCALRVQGFRFLNEVYGGRSWWNDRFSSYEITWPLIFQREFMGGDLDDMIYFQNTWLLIFQTEFIRASYVWLQTFFIGAILTKMTILKKGD